MAEQHKMPYTRDTLYCPDCGQTMSITTRASEKPEHSSPITWSCGSCKKSWSVPVRYPNVTAVDYDDGSR